MLLLALDTSAAHCAAALLSDGVIVASRTEPMARGQAERLLPMAEEVLAEAGLRWGDLTALGVGVGPGNFTGIRIAVSAVRGLALGLEIPAIGVTSFEAHAEGRPQPLVVALDARRERAYVQGFGTAPQAPALLPTKDLAGLVDAVPFLTDLPDQGGEHIGAPDPAAIARVAARRADRHAPPPAPLYLRPADAAPPREAPPLILDDA